MLILLRHARTSLNAQGRLQGQRDVSLDEVGIEQARSVGAYLRRHYDIATVITSPLRRCIETMDEAGLATAEVVIDDRWREINFGSDEGRRIDGATVDFVARWREDPDWVPDAGVESLAGLHRRVGSALEAAQAVVASLPKDRCALVVSHTLPVKSALAHSLGAGAPMILRVRVDVAAVSTLSLSGASFSLRSFNERPFVGSP